MKILILSKWGGAISLGWRLVKEGHKVQMWIEPCDGEQSHVGDGFIPKTKDWKESKDWADFIVIDYSGFGKISESLKKEGKIVWGGTDWSDQIELDRGLGQKTLKDVGMTIIPSKDFKSPQEASAWLKSNPGKYVVKPSGPIQDEKALTYVGKEENGADLMAVLEQYQTKWAGKITKVELQEVKEGIEVAVSGFFNGKEFVEPIEVSFEHKALMNDGIGPKSGEMGTSMVWMKKNRIYKESIGKMVKLLAEHNYTGYIDINCIADQKTLWPLEFTTRFGYPTIQLKMETIKGNMGDWMYRVASGEKKNFLISNPYSLCVVVATPPYPFQSGDLYEKYGEGQLVIFRGKDKTGIWPGEVLRDKDGKWFLDGESGFSVIVTGSGKNMKDAKTLCYRRVDSLVIPNSFYRTDISDKTEDDLKKLNSWGWF